MGHHPSRTYPSWKKFQLHLIIKNKNCFYVESKFSTILTDTWVLLNPPQPLLGGLYFSRISYWRVPFQRRESILFYLRLIQNTLQYVQARLCPTFR